MKLLTTAQINQLPNGTALRGLLGERAVKGLDYL